MTQQLKRISHLVIVAPSFARNDEDGIVIPPLQLYLAELKTKYPNLTISVIALHFPHSNVPYLWKNCSIYPMNGQNKSLILRPLLWQKTLSRLKKIHRNTPIDCIQSFWYNEPAWLGEKMAQKIKVPHVNTMMGQDARKDNAYRNLIRSKTILRVTLSGFQKKVFESHATTKIDRFIPFGISDLDSDLWNLAQQDRTTDLICVSSLIPLKQVHLFVALVAKIKAQFPEIKVEIVGDGKERKSIIALIGQLGLEKNISLLGEIPRKACLSRMNQAKILVHTSAYEGQGYVLNEALALGCKVVALSSGLIIENPNFCLATDLKHLEQQVLNWLNENNQEFKSQVPVNMRQTVLSYEALLREKGVAF